MKVITLTVLGVFCFLGALSISAEESKEKGKKEVVEKEILTVTAAKAQELLAKKKAPVVIDIRTLGEFQAGHLPGSKMIDYQSADFREKLAKLDRNQSYLFHCQSGGRSTRALKVWEELGFKKVYHLKSGFAGWEKAGGKVEK